MQEQIEKLKDIIKNSDKIVAFTGSGISAESGIPTYRGAGGLWTKYDPDKYASIGYFMKDPSYYWRFFRDERYDKVFNADPNPAHYALAKLELSGKLSAVITQNIDGLHQKSGSKRVLELHGNTTRFYCLNCRKGFTIQQARQMVEKELPPRCDCGGILRPDVVLYGEMLPQDVVEEASLETQQCDLMIIIGSSLITYPAADLPYQAKMHGAKLVIINIDPTSADGMCDLVIHHPAAEILSQAVDL